MFRSSDPGRSNFHFIATFNFMTFYLRFDLKVKYVKCIPQTNSYSSTIVIGFIPANFSCLKAWPSNLKVKVMTYIHTLTYISHGEMWYSKVHESNPLQPIRNELEAKIVNLTQRNPIMCSLWTLSQLQNHRQHPCIVPEGQLPWKQASTDNTSWVRSQNSQIKKKMS